MSEEKIVIPIERRLKECPHCGGKATFMAQGRNHYIVCDKCGCRSPMGLNKDWIVERWNNRNVDERWIPVTEKLPEDKTWYLGIFKESDTGYCISVPFVCYYAGRKTMITTKDYWILREYQDIYSFSEYYRNLECAAWMPLPEPYRGE